MKEKPFFTLSVYPNKAGKIIIQDKAQDRIIIDVISRAVRFLG